MGRISRRALNKVLEERMFELLWEHLARLSTSSLIREFFLSLLSNTELTMISKRLAIAILLSRGYSYKYIDEMLKVSLATIGTVHRQIQTGALGYDRAIAEANKKRKRDAFWDTFEEVLLQLSLPAREGSAKHQLKSELGKELRKRKFQHEVIG